jgi:hypothetical protein
MFIFCTKIDMFLRYVDFVYILHKKTDSVIGVYFFILKDD